MTAPHVQLPPSMMIARSRCVLALARCNSNLVMRYINLTVARSRGRMICTCYYAYSYHFTPRFHPVSYALHVLGSTSPPSITWPTLCSAPSRHKTISSQHYECVGLLLLRCTIIIEHHGFPFFSHPFMVECILPFGPILPPFRSNVKGFMMRVALEFDECKDA